MVTENGKARKPTRSSKMQEEVDFKEKRRNLGGRRGSEGKWGGERGHGWEGLQDSF